MMKPVIFLTFIAILLSCKKASEKQGYTLQLSRLRQSYADAASISNGNMLIYADSLRSYILTFTNVPTPPTHNLVKQAWRKLQNQVILSGPYGKQFGNIDPFYNYTMVSQLSLYPINPAYLDYTSSSTGGIIPDEGTYPIINNENMLAWHQAGGQANASLGMHAAEFLIWGEDLSTSGSGQRVPNDFIGNSGPTWRRKNAFRIQIVELINTIQSSNLISTTNQHLSADPLTSFDVILGQLLLYIKEDFAEKAILTPYASQNEQDEISRFSDNTLNDLISMVSSIRMYLDPKEMSPINNGYGLLDLAKEFDHSRADKIIILLDELEQTIGDIELPFDRAILSASERPKIYEIYNKAIQLHNELELFGTDFRNAQNK